MPIRVTGGDFGGRLIPSPLSSKTRPTASMTREALFNILFDVSDYTVLDLFAGSGIVGIEALSRGAKCVYAVEQAHRQAHQIYKAYQSLGIEKSLHLLEKNVLTLTQGVLPISGGFDLIYADPPFTEDYPDLQPFLKWLSPQGTAVFECASRNVPKWANNAKVKRYGESTLLFFKSSL
ncbi:MAG: 16S rRNA (guanine(966)-N(2))-methyltransferase RsmD [Fibrobacter sp.]|jgi:16S rRNA (guanine966-N2)-methyltransferase|nr:16S rRNA (guanine(966)-N(2))-methyltransferase RsmD [Fibrobacter sp.]